MQILMTVYSSEIEEKGSMCALGSEIYSEKYRPQFHFSPKENWMNDPNGMVYYEGEYHLFYQYYPDSTVWGPMHWGHAVSKDLVHWKHLPIALYPDSLGFVFSGSAVVDWNNTSGFGSKAKPPMVAVFTYHNVEKEKAGRNDYQTQGIAFSNDKGRTWTKYTNNPVVKNPGVEDFRDPKVVWHKKTQKWIMTIVAHDHVSFYSSSNLIDWTFESNFGKGYGAHGGVWECPDLFLMTTEDNEKKWILICSIISKAPNGGSGTQYFVGEFDGHQFYCETSGIKWIDYGKDNYAGVTWSNIPESDGRKIFIGWMSNWQYANNVPTEKWRGIMTIPRNLKLLKVQNDYLLSSVPIKEMELLREKSLEFLGDEIIANSGFSKIAPFSFAPLEIVLNVKWDKQPVKFGIQLKNSIGEIVDVYYEGDEGVFIIDRTKLNNISFSKDFAGLHKIPIVSEDGLKLQILIDESSIEVFGNNGQFVMTELLFPVEKFNEISLYSQGDEIIVDEAKFYRLKSIW